MIIHHKFIVIDAETDSPVVYSGSANMSNASQYGNDENLLRNSWQQAHAGYRLAEFMRLYEHYRARALFIRRQQENSMTTFRLDDTSRWSKKYYIPGTPEERSKRRMAREPVNSKNEGEEIVCQAMGRFRGTHGRVAQRARRRSATVRLLNDFWYDDRENKRWSAPAGSVIDGASIPASLWSFIGSPYTGEYRRPSVVHDVACDDPNIPRKDADRMFYYACLAGGCYLSSASPLYRCADRFLVL